MLGLDFNSTFSTIIPQKTCICNWILDLLTPVCQNWQHNIQHHHNGHLPKVVPSVHYCLQFWLIAMLHSTASIKLLILLMIVQMKMSLEMTAHLSGPVWTTYQCTSPELRAESKAFLVFIHSWPHNTTCLSKKAKKYLYFLERLKRMTSPLQSLTVGQ